MRIWHKNVEDPHTSQQSVVPIPRERQTQEGDMQVTLEDFEVAASAVNTTPVRPKRQKRPRRGRGNDSVSRFKRSFYIGSNASQSLRTDKDGDVAFTPTDNTG
jgi:hypothetical protein